MPRLNSCRGGDPFQMVEPHQRLATSNSSDTKGGHELVEGLGTNRWGPLKWRDRLCSEPFRNGKPPQLYPPTNGSSPPPPLGPLSFFPHAKICAGCANLDPGKALDCVITEKGRSIINSRLILVNCM